MDTIGVISSEALAQHVKNKSDKGSCLGGLDLCLIIDSRTFYEYNTNHIFSSVNVWSSKIRKRKLQHDSISVHEYLEKACQVTVPSEGKDIIVYDQTASSLPAVPQDSFLQVLLTKLGKAFSAVYLLEGGFLDFQAKYPDLCEDSTKKALHLTSLSQPCLPVANVGPTKILPFLFLGSQHDANDRQMLQDYNIMYELNVSVSCPKPDFVQDSHFFRIPVNDNFNEKLLPFFRDAFKFIDKVKEIGGRVLVHCLAGISRSPTIAIAYVMKHLRLPYDEAYRYVKSRRPTISPNISFVGQLIELDQQLRQDGSVTENVSETVSAPVGTSADVNPWQSLTFSVLESSSTLRSRHQEYQVRSGVPRSLSLNLKTMLEDVPASPPSPHSPNLSPTSALAKLSFASEDCREEYRHTCRLPSSPVTPPVNCEGDKDSLVFSYTSDTASVFSSLTDSGIGSFHSFKDASSLTGSFNSNSKLSIIDEKLHNNDSDEYCGEIEKCFSGFRDSGSYLSTAEIEINSESDLYSCQSSDRVGRSLYVIEVDHEPSKVQYVKSTATEPMIVKETKIYANVCSDHNHKDSIGPETILSNKDVRRTYSVPISVSCEDSLQRKNRPQEFVLSSTVASQLSKDDKMWQPKSPKEAITADLAEDAEYPCARAAGLEPSDSGCCVNDELKRIPRCYSSGEAHINTRKLLEQRAGNIFLHNTRKSSSSDEVCRGWTHHPPPQLHVHPSPQHIIMKDGGNLWACPTELARCDSWSTSGFGSEISDWESVHDDAHSTNFDEAVGPFDAVFSDVFPGDFNEFQPFHQTKESEKMSSRPSSLLGIADHPMTSVSSEPQEQEIDMVDGGVELEDGVELRKAGSRGRRGGNNESGYFSFINEHQMSGLRSSVDGSSKYYSNKCTRDGKPRDLTLHLTTPNLFVPSPPVGQTAESFEFDDSELFMSREPQKEHHIASEIDCASVSMVATKLRDKTSEKNTQSSSGDKIGLSSNLSQKTRCEESFIPPESREVFLLERRKLRSSEKEETHDIRKGFEDEMPKSSSISKTSVAKTGSSLAEIIVSFENMFELEFSELKRQTKVLSEKFRPHSGFNFLSSKNAEAATLPFKIKNKEVDKHSMTFPLLRVLNSACKGYRARSEPPIFGKESLYRANSCPGLPQGEFKGNLACFSGIRRTRNHSNKENIFNRYSCGDIDLHLSADASDEAPYLSCPDFGKLKPLKEGSKNSSLSSSASVSRHFQILCT